MHPDYQRREYALSLLSQLYTDPLIKSARSFTSAGVVDLSSEPTIHKVGIFIFAAIDCRSASLLLHMFVYNPVPVNVPACFYNHLPWIDILYKFRKSRGYPLHFLQ